MPISNDYDAESIGLFQSNPREHRFTSLLFKPCTSECQWSYLDRTEEGKLYRVFRHTLEGETREGKIEFALVDPMNSIAAMQDIADEHHTERQPAQETAPRPQETTPKVGGLGPQAKPPKGKGP